MLYLFTYTNQHSAPIVPYIYKQKTHLNHVQTPGTLPVNANTKYEYRITSVTLHAISIEL